MADMHGRRKYIAAGCLAVPLPGVPWALGQAHAEATAPLSWASFSHSQQEAAPGGAQLALAQPIQDHLLKSTELAACAGLLGKRWIGLEFAVSRNDPAWGIARVRVLPDDVDRALVSRADAALSKAKKDLLSRLDYSPGAWSGLVSPPGTRADFPSLFEPASASEAEDADVSLLQMFNSIPSPDPRPETVQNVYAREAMAALLDGQVAELKTTLYPYQRRSAALMLQREAQSAQMLDPRLVHVVDQDGKPWYYDPVTSVALREPRRYDGIRGGILAEEMGAGKTLICLALILATKHQPAEIPELYRGTGMIPRRKVGSLMDMVAAAITRNSLPWSLYFAAGSDGAPSYPSCVKAIERNRGWYDVPRPETRRESRYSREPLPPTRVYLSRATLVIVPANLLKQWTQEIAKHTAGLRVAVFKARTPIPPVDELLKYDAILFAIPRFERLWQDDRMAEPNGAWRLNSPLAQIHFKRCIVDEGHKLGNSRVGAGKTNILLVLDCLQISARWIVTGTPSQGLFGVEEQTQTGALPTDAKRLAESSSDQERRDLERIGSIATLYLKARPWSNTADEDGDNPADWRVYVMQPKHSPRSSGRKDCLRSTFESLIIRHRLAEVGDLLPPVSEKVVSLEGSYQDKLSLNLFSMMIIFNAVQSQRTDQDYFFHPRQRKSLMQLVHNLRQSSFFGGSFFSTGEIDKAVETAETFLEEKHVAISAEDERLLREAIAMGKVAFHNKVKEAASLFHEVPLFVKDFPRGLGEAWSMDGKDRDPICTNHKMILALQKLLTPYVDAPQGLELLLDSGKFAQEGRSERQRELEEGFPARRGPEAEDQAQGPTLAGNTKLGEDSLSPRKRLSAAIKEPGAEAMPTPPLTPDREIAEPLARTRIISTFSAKLSYLVDAVNKHQEEEQIIIFYENDNVAWYLSGVLEILQIHHLIYAKGITAERRAQYVATFNHNPKFRVLLMDITQAAFGLDMRSASRIYFINPVLNPQVEAQAIGRARRISQKKKVSVETLVLKGSLEEIIVERKQKMTQAEHRKCKTILDDRPIYEWILNAKILPLPEGDVPEPEQMAPLHVPQYVFGRRFGRERSHPDEDLLTGDEPSPVRTGGKEVRVPLRGSAAVKRQHAGPEKDDEASGLSDERPARRVKFAVDPGAALATPLPPPKKAVRVRFADE